MTRRAEHTLRAVAALAGEATPGLVTDRLSRTFASARYIVVLAELERLERDGLLSVQAIPTAPGSVSEAHYRVTERGRRRLREEGAKACDGRRGGTH
ncbi:MAG TPA: hypothetical protein VNH18_08020 [Bryobacteraceae bacterium]|nr:hypothetical protein [Bryobacteraceae bacterium]